jgi:mRNA interferase MazF
MVKAEAPERGDIIWLSFSPQLGNEQAGRRPGLVLSPKYYNRPSRLCLCCPITSRVKGYPFEVILPEGLPVSGAVAADQMKSYDWEARQAEFITHAPEEVITATIEKLYALLDG